MSIANDVGLSRHFVEGLMTMIVGAVVERHRRLRPASKLSVAAVLPQPGIGGENRSSSRGLPCRGICDVVETAEINARRR